MATHTFRQVAVLCDTATVRRWALARGIEVSPRGGLPRFVYEDYLREQAEAAAVRPGPAPASAAARRSG